MIKAIETVYKGYRFRSRLEARWAVFFDALDIKWEYEPEGYQSGRSRYLPDFRLPVLKCFVEIKGDHPTSRELQKIKHFVSYSSETVYVFTGSQFAPFDCSRPPVFIPNPEHENENIIVGEDKFFHENGQELSSEELEKWNEVPRFIMIDDGTRGSGAIEYSSIDGTVNSSGPFAFVQCPRCQRIAIIHLFTPIKEALSCCYSKEEKGLSVMGIDLDIQYYHRLTAAYTAARQARFEHGEKP